MNKGGIGVGSASIVLVFAVLCLTVFTLITFVVAGNDKALVDTEVRLVTGYYKADTLAENILQDIREMDELPDPPVVRGIYINAEYDFFTGMETIHFFCPVSGVKSLYVRAAVYYDDLDVIAWRMLDTDEWEYDDSLNVWDGTLEGLLDQFYND